MAEVACRFHRLGNCLAGDSCRFSHSSISTTAPTSRSTTSSTTTAATAATTRQVCRFYREGNCSYGSQCHNLHVDSSADQQQFYSLEDEFPSLSVSATPFIPQQQQQKQQNRQQQQQQSSNIINVNAPEFVPKATPKTSLSDAMLNAPEFVPKQQQQQQQQPKTWSQVVLGDHQHERSDRGQELSLEEAESELCPFGISGVCRYESKCAYVHGEQCEFCFEYVLHPNHPGQRKEHEKKCLVEHEKQMEAAFAFSKSKDITCGICMETVVTKSKGDARFGILPNCNHAYCLPCIRKWRCADFENKIIRSCPECRQVSDYVCPSRFWVDTQEEKEKLFSEYKRSLRGKDCKYFKKGDGECPFGNKCFYQHVNVAGDPVDVGPPKRTRRRFDADGQLTAAERLLINEFLEEREGRLFLQLDLMDMFSDSDSDEFITFETR